MYYGAIYMGLLLDFFLLLQLAAIWRHAFFVPCHIIYKFILYVVYRMAMKGFAA